MPFVSAYDRPTLKARIVPRPAGRRAAAGAVGRINDLLDAPARRAVARRPDRERPPGRPRSRPGRASSTR